MSDSDHRALIDEAKEQDLERRFGSWQDLDLNADGTEADPIENIVTDAAAMIDRLATALEQKGRALEIAVALAEDRNVYWQIAQTAEATERAEIAERRAAGLLDGNNSLRERLLETDARWCSAERRVAELEPDAATMRNAIEGAIVYLKCIADDHSRAIDVLKASIASDAGANLARDLASARAWASEHADHLLGCNALGGRWDRDSTWRPPAGPCTCGRDGPGAASAASSQEKSDSGVSTKQLHQGMHTGRKPRRTGG